jgi:hypothetical protein
MEGKAIKIPKLLNTLWNHKKKTILASGALIYGFDILRDYNRCVGHLKIFNTIRTLA